MLQSKKFFSEPFINYSKTILIKKNKSNIVLIIWEQILI